jgi:hypothetical protein
MTEEDEAFEDLAKRQGDWGMQGSRKHQIMRYAENVENKGTSMTDREAMKLALFALDIVKIHYTQNRHVNEAIAALKERLAQEKALQTLHNENERLGLYRDAYAEPVQYKCTVIDNQHPNGIPLEQWVKPPQRTEQNFCPRCGKRTKDMTHIHTCTPPQENT